VRHRFDYSQLRILPPRKQIVEVTLPIGVGARANEGLAVDQEGGRAAHPAIGALAIIGRDPRRLLVAVEALPELADVELKLLGIAQERLEILDITAAPAARRGAFEQPVVHRPEAALLGRAVGDMRGQQRAGMDIDQRKIAIDEIDFAGLDILLFEPGLRLTDEGVTVRSLEVAVLDHSDRRVWVALRALFGRGRGILGRRGSEGRLVARRGRSGGARRGLAAAGGQGQRHEYKRW
jgi:hypothetical protein